MALEDVNRLAMRPFRLSWRQSRRTITSQRSHTAGSWDKNAKNASSVVARRAVDSLARRASGGGKCEETAWRSGSPVTTNSTPTFPSPSRLEVINFPRTTLSQPIGAVCRSPDFPLDEYAADGASFATAGVLVSEIQSHQSDWPSAMTSPRFIRATAT